jgi:hypothetical protein
MNGNSEVRQMRLSEFIDQLEWLKAAHGDVEIGVLEGITIYGIILQTQQLGNDDTTVTHVSILSDDDVVIY